MSAMPNHPPGVVLPDGAALPIDIDEPPQLPPGARQLEIEDAILLNDSEQRLSDFLVATNNDFNLAGECLVDSYTGIPDMIRLVLTWVEPTVPDVDSLLYDATVAVIHDNEDTLIPQIDDRLAASDFSLPEVAAVARSPHWNSVFTAITARHPTSTLRNALQRENRLTAAEIDKAALHDSSAFSDEFVAMLIAAMAAPDADLPVHCPQPPASAVAATPGSDAIPRDRHAHFLNRLAVLCTFDECATKAALYILARLTRCAESVLSRTFFRRLSQHIRREAVAAIMDICAPGNTSTPEDESMSPSQAFSTTSVVDDAPADTGGADAARARTLAREAEALSFVAGLAITADGAAAGLAVRQSLMDALLTLSMSRDDTGLSVDGRARVSAAARIMTPVFGTLIGTLTLGGAPVADKRDVPDDVKLDPITFTEKAVLIRAVCHEEVVRQLLDAAFSVDRRVPRGAALFPEKRKSVCILLAFAGTFLTMKDAHMEDLLRERERAQVMCADVIALLKRIDELVVTCEALKPGSAKYMLKKEPSQLIATACKDSFLARGVLIWSRESLHGGENLRDLLYTAPAHLAFLRLLALHNVALRGAVVEVLRDALVRDYGDLADTEVAELHKRYVKCLIDLMRLHVGVEIVTMLEKDVAENSKVDVSFLRLFVVEALRLVKPVYSPEFATVMLRLLNVPRVLRVSMKLNDDVSRLVRKFRQDAADMGVS